MNRLKGKAEKTLAVEQVGFKIYLLSSIYFRSTAEEILNVKLIICFTKDILSAYDKS